LNRKVWLPIIEASLPRFSHGPAEDGPFSCKYLLQNEAAITFFLCGLRPTLGPGRNQVDGKSALLGLKPRALNSELLPVMTWRSANSWVRQVVLDRHNRRPRRRNLFCV